MYVKTESGIQKVPDSPFLIKQEQAPPQVVVKAVDPSVSSVKWWQWALSALLLIIVILFLWYMFKK